MAEDSTVAVYKYTSNKSEFDGTVQVTVEDSDGNVVEVPQGGTVSLTDEQVKKLREHFNFTKQDSGEEATADADAPADEEVETNVAQATGPSVEGNDKRTARK